MDQPPEIPEGFARHVRKSAVTDPWEPLWARRTEHAVQLGLRIAEPHCNARGFLHGGVIASLADNAMGMSVVVAAGAQSALTVSLQLDYVEAASIGEWLQFEPRVIRAAGKLGFADALVTAGGRTIARASATFRILA
jgi:uncharacterized protein (TIGR00369 family)